MLDAGGREIGSSRIEKLEAGCLIQESWTAARGGTGRSLNYYDPAAKRWRQNWVDSRGGVVRYEGEYRDGAMHFAGVHIGPRGLTTSARVTLEALPNGHLRHHIEHSGDGGSSWQTYFLGTYVPLREARAGLSGRRRDRGPAPDPASRPPAAAEATIGLEAPTAPPAAGSSAPGTGSVAIESRLDVAEARREGAIAVTSPMVVRFPVGPVHRVPDGYGWSNREVAAYVCEGVTIRQVHVERRQRRGSVQLSVTLSLVGRGTLKKAAVELELLAGGTPVAAAELGTVSVGLGVQDQIENGSVEKRVILELEPQRFAELFEAAEPPELRITLTVR